MFGQSDVGRHPLPPDLGFENLRLSVAELPSIPLIFPWSWRQSSAQFAINRSVFFGVSLIFSIQKISFIQLYLVWTRCYLVTRWDKDRAIRASSCCCVAPPPILLRNPWHFTSEPFILRNLSSNPYRSHVWHEHIDFLSTGFAVLARVYQWHSRWRRFSVATSIRRNLSSAPTKQFCVRYYGH